MSVQLKPRFRLEITPLTILYDACLQVYGIRGIRFVIRCSHKKSNASVLNGIWRNLKHLTLVISYDKKIIMSTYI